MKRPAFQGRDLINRLHGREVDPVELENLLYEHFKTNQLVDNGVAFFKGDRIPAAVTLTFTSRGKLRALIGGPTVDAADEEAIQKKVEAVLLSPPVRKVAREVLFSPHTVDS